MKRTHKTVAAAVILAATSGAAIVGCRAFYSGSADPAAVKAASALADGSGGVQAIAAQTNVAEKQVQKAIPHSDVKGQAYLEAASDAHAAVLVSNTRVESALDAAGRHVLDLQQQLEQSAQQLRSEQEKLLHLQGQWYVSWGVRIERWLWTAAITWLLVSIGSMLLGTGNPVSWIASLRAVISQMSQRWSVSGGGLVK